MIILVKLILLVIYTCFLGDVRRRYGIELPDKPYEETDRYKEQHKKFVDFQKAIPKMVEFVPLHNSVMLFDKE